jgi:hypothetical protein
LTASGGGDGDGGTGEPHAEELSALLPPELYAVAQQTIQREPVIEDLDI